LPLLIHGRAAVACSGAVPTWIIDEPGIDSAKSSAEPRRGPGSSRRREARLLDGASMGGAAVVQNSAGIQVDGLISLSGTRLWPGYGVNDPAGVRSLSAPFLYVGSRDDWRAPRAEALSVFHSVGSNDKHVVLYAGSTHGWALVAEQPYGSRTRATFLKWIARRN